MKKENGFSVVTSCETTNSVFNIIDENKTFSITTPVHWNVESAKKTIEELNKLIDLRPGYDIDWNVEQVRKKGIVLINDYFLSSLGTFENEILDDKKSQDTMILKKCYIDSN